MRQRGRCSDNSVIIVFLFRAAAMQAGGKLKTANKEMLTDLFSSALGNAQGNAREGEVVDSRKLHGSYYTPGDTVRSLVRWAVRKQSDRLLDPSCGDGRFLALHKRSVGVEQGPQAASVARCRAPWALIHEGDFFGWAASTKERFECAAGNPPFIRYQRFAGEVRQQALDLCASLGAPFSALTSSWAPFLVATASLLKPGGRIAFVVPAEIGHAPYAIPLIEYLFHNFSTVCLVAVRRKIFRELSEDVWLLYADGFSGQASHILLSPQETFSFSPEPPRAGIHVTIDDWRAWNCRLRSFLAGSEARDIYARVLAHESTTRLGAVAQIGIGYVTGANEFFHLRPSLADKMDIPKSLLQPTVRNSRALAGESVTKATLREWVRSDAPVLLLRLSSAETLPGSVRAYLDTAEGKEARASYKCRHRSPWYVVPDVIVPDAFLSYMSSSGPALVANQAGCTCTNSVHTVRLKGNMTLADLQSIWPHPFTRLSCEIEGHPLGGGMLKVEPREAQRIVLARRRKGWDPHEIRSIEEGLHALRSWRHHAA